MRRMTRFRALLLTLPLALACGGNDSSTSDGFDGGADGGGDDGGDDGDGDGGGDDGGDGSDDGGTGEGGDDGGDGGDEPMQVMARDIRLTDMFINQGVRIPLVANGSWVPPQQRPVELVADRGALVRASWVIPDDWEPRLLEGRLYLDVLGEEKMLQSVVQVESESYEGDLTRTFSWLIEAPDVRQETTFHVEIWEAKPGQEDEPEPEVPPVLPVDGPAPLGVENTLMKMRATLVPVTYDGRTPEITEEQVQRFYDFMFQRNALNVLEVDVHPGVSIPGEIYGFETVLEYVQGLHDQDGAGYNHYYYGIIDVGGPDLGGAGGMAWSVVSAGLWWDEKGKFPFRTFVHEIGHNQGRPHSPGCDAGYPDYSYPDQSGKTQTWGFGVIDHVLKHPTVNHDYMSYCTPEWVSEWTWVRTASVIASQSGSPGAPAPWGQRGEVLLGYVDAGGELRWRVSAGVVDPTSVTPGEHVRFTAADGEVVELPASVHANDAGTPVVIAPLPWSFDEIAAIEHLGGDGTVRRVALEAVTTR